MDTKTYTFKVVVEPAVGASKDKDRPELKGRFRKWTRTLRREASLDSNEFQNTSPKK